MGKFVWLEALLPLGIIAGMLCVMGNAQYYIHKAAHGRVRLFFFLFYCFKAIACISICADWFDFERSMTVLILMQPKHIGNDVWDVAMERRDEKLMESGN